MGHGPETCEVRASLPAGDRPQAIEAWLAVLGQCQRDASYLAMLGHMLNRSARYSEARDHLERALLFEPEHRQARVDYAIALAGVGDVASAQGMLDLLLSEPGLPPQLRESLQRQYTLLAELDGTRWQTRITATARLGHDSNLGGAPNLGSLTLTVAGQPVLLPLDESYRARAGVYARADVQLEMRRNLPDGSRWDLIAGVRARRSPTVSSAGTSTADILLERNHQYAREGDARTSGPYAGVAIGFLQTQAGIRYASVGAMAGWAMHWREGLAQGCQGRMGGELQQRQHQTNGILTGHYAGLVVGLACERESGSQALLSLRAGQDSAQNSTRPGGDQQQASLRLAFYSPLSAWNRQAKYAALRAGGMLFDVEVSRYQDAAGYSPVLQGGAIRNLNRQTARIEYQSAVAEKLQWVVGVEWVRQRSSLELFQLRSHGPYTALRAIW